MVLPSSSVGSHLTPAEANTYLVCLASCYEDGPLERRSEPRYSTDTPATVAVLSPRPPTAFPVRLTDVGRNGIGMRVSQHLAVDSRVRVSTESVEIVGRILWAKDTAVGLQIEDVRMRESGE